MTTPGTPDESIPVIDLSAAPGERAARGRPAVVRYLWAVFEPLFVTNSWQISSGLRCAVLRMFGAEIGRGVIFRLRARVSLPWKLHVGERSWIGEGAWLHKQDHIYIGHDVVISQETFLTTGSHAHRRDMALITRPIPIAERSLRRRVMDRSWITTTWSALRNSHPSRRRMIASTAPPPCPLCVNLGQGTRTVRISVVEGGEKVPTMSTTMTAAPRTGQAVSVEGVPDPQVPEKARRRTYTAKCKPRFGCLS